MLTQDDLQAIGNVIDEKLTAQSESFGRKLETLGNDFDQKLEKQKTEILQDVDVKLIKLGRDFEQKLEKQKTEIIQAVADTIHDSLLLLLDNHDDRIERLEKNAGLTPIPVSGQ